MNIPSMFAFDNMVAPLASALILLIILVVSFRSRAVVFSQYLNRMTGIRLKPKDVKRAYRERGKEGVRDLFLDLLIREDLRHGPISVPEAAPEEPAGVNR
jgi:hypothetical protein